MAARLIHTNEGAECPLCAQKLRTACDLLQQWFPVIKRKFPDCHISWAWRGETDQNTFKMSGDSGVAWPKSKHNKMDTQGRASAEALDLFKLVKCDKAEFPVPFYRAISAYSDECGWADRVRWALTDKDGKRYDLDHFSVCINSGAANRG